MRQGCPWQEAEARREMLAVYAESHLEWGRKDMGTLVNTITMVRLYFPKLRRRLLSAQ